uniref:CPSF_A domain-containing protein n=1 Tax=Globodera pallida TaxID=36090 RepID=A0A183CD97_GLOPA
MDVVLSRVDYAHVGTTSNGCLCVIQNLSANGRAEDQPAGASEDTGEKVDKLGRRGRRGSRKGEPIALEDKVVVGGQNGVLLCMERRNNDTNILYKTPPGPPISRVYLGGALGSVQDKAFVACGTEVRGYSRKGKQFLAFESNLTEEIRSLFIYGVDMFIGGNNSHYQFHDCVEKSHFFCADQIMDCVCLPVTEGGWVGRGLTPVLACADKTIKVLEGSRLVYEVPVGDVPTVLHLFCNDGGYNKQKVLFGCRNGVIGLVDLGVDYSTVSQQIETKSFATVAAIHCYPLVDQKGSRPDVVVGKEDGLIELYAVDENDTLAFRQLVQCEERITGLCCGRVGSSHFPEIVVSTYSGWLFGLTTEPVFAMSESSTSGTNRQQQDETGGGETSSSAMAPQMEVKVRQMRMELDELESRVRTERERFHGEIAAAAAQQQQNGAVQQSQQPVAELASLDFTVNDRFALRKELACYTLSVELTVPIDYVLMQSDVSVDLLDVERNSAVTSKTEPEPGSGNALLAVYRCQTDITRMEMRIRSIEGQFGTLRLYIVPRLIPLTCKVSSFFKNL